MSVELDLKRLSSRFAARKDGNFGMMAAIALPAILAAVGIALDVSRIMTDNAQLGAALDAASLATASALSSGTIAENEALAFATKIAAGQLQNTLSPSQIAAFKQSVSAPVSVVVSGNQKTYTVKVTGQFSEELLAFSAFHAGGERFINGSSTSTSAAKLSSGLSLYLVLDRSGSMSWTTTTVDTSQPWGCYNYFEQYWPYASYSRPCYINKMGSLKAAAAVLFDKLDDIENADPTNTVVRTGAISFTDSTQNPSNLAWGTKNARNYVNGLPTNPTGGTDMTGGMSTANSALNAQSEINAQSAKGNTSFKKFLILMTDGENTGSSGSWQPSLDAATLSTCNAARAAGTTIYTVAYMAPANGENLLKSCAGTPSNYYKASDMDSLVKAFNDIGGKVVEQQTRMVE